MDKKGRIKVKDLMSKVYQCNEILALTLNSLNKQIKKSDIGLIIKHCVFIAENETNFFPFFKKRYLLKSDIFYEKDGYYFLNEKILNYIKENAKNVEFIQFFDKN